MHRPVWNAGQGRAGGSCSGVADVSLTLGKMCQPTRTVPQQSPCSHSCLGGCSLAVALSFERSLFKHFPHSLLLVTGVSRAGTVG